jgi:hypothetical protein
LASSDVTAISALEPTIMRAARANRPERLPPPGTASWFSPGSGMAPLGLAARTRAASTEEMQRVTWCLLKVAQM